MDVEMNGRLPIPGCAIYILQCNYNDSISTIYSIKVAHTMDWYLDFASHPP